jgi:formamidopyrimidine-DNA glycosylase
VLFAERVHPRRPVAELDDATLARLYRRARELLLASVARGRMPRNVYRRRRQPCPRCGAAIEGAMDGNQRQMFWCPRCQAP